MHPNDLEEILRDFNLGDYVLLVNKPNKIYRISDIIDDSPSKEPWSQDYDIFVVDVNTEEEFNVTKKEVIKLSNEQQKLAKLIYD